MGEWSGRGIPPTRRKLHRWRKAQYLASRADAAEQRSVEQNRSYTWGRLTRKTIINPEKFEELWG